MYLLDNSESYGYRLTVIKGYLKWHYTQNLLTLIKPLFVKDGFLPNIFSVVTEFLMNYNSN